MRLTAKQYRQGKGKGNRWYAKAKACWVLDGHIYEEPQKCPEPKLEAMRREWISDMQQRGGERFQSKHEAREWLKLLSRALRGEVTELDRQVKFKLELNGVLIAIYTADFVYKEAGRPVVADAKGTWETPRFKLLWKLMEALYPQYERRLVR